MTRSRRYCIILWMLILNSGVTFAQVDASTKYRIASWTIDPLMTQSQEQRIIAALNEPANFQWKNEPLGDVVRQLGKSLPMVLDHRSIEEIGLSHETPVTARGGQAIGIALTLALRELDLTYTIRAGSVEITTIQNAQDDPLIRVYDITLLVCYEGFPVTNRFADVDSLESMIQTAIAPDNCEAGNVRFPSMVVADRIVMVIRQRQEIHAEIQAVLDTLSQIAKGKKRRLPSDAAVASVIAPTPLMKKTSDVFRSDFPVETAQQADAGISLDVSDNDLQHRDNAVTGKSIACWSADPFMTEQQGQRIIEALQEPATKHWHRIPLDQVVKDLSGYFPAEVDWVGLQRTSISGDVTLTSTVTGGSTLASVLFSGLKSIGLTAELSAGRLIITTPEDAGQYTTIKIYDITPLVESEEGIEQMMQVLEQSVEPETWESHGGNSIITPFATGERFVLIIRTTMLAHLECHALLNRLNQLRVD